MKPNFALSLSFEGIRLLHRLGNGWSLVGEVPLDAPDLAQQLAMLRKTGLALDPQGLRTKLLIPNEQIKYLALDTTRAADDDVRRALDGVTPYPVDDLVYDYVRGGGRTYIAAVARDTLTEAEAFAAEHRFGPVCFAGVPAPFTYVGEAFFGQTTLAQQLVGADQIIERDELAVAYVARPRGPGPTAVTGAVSVAEAVAEVAVTPPAADPIADPTAEPMNPSDPALAAETGMAPDLAAPVVAADIPSAGSADAFDPGLPDTESALDAPDVSVIDAAPPADAPRAPLVPEPVFSSRARPLRADAADVPPAARPLPPPPGSRTPILTHIRADAPADNRADPVFSRRTEPPVFNAKVARPNPAQATLPLPLMTDPVIAAPDLMQPQPALKGAALNGAAPQIDPQVDPQFAAQFATQTASQMAPPRLTGAARTAGDGLAVRPVNTTVPDPAAAPAVTGTSGTARPAAAVAATVIPFRPNAETGPVATPVSIETVTLTKAKPAVGSTVQQPIATALIQPGQAGYFAGQHGNPAAKAAANAAAVQDRSRVGGKPRFLALILTLILLACLAAVAAWATFMSDTGIAGLFGLTPATAIATEADPEAPPLSAPQITETALIAPNPEAETAAPAAVPTEPATDAQPNVALSTLPQPDGGADLAPEVAATAPADETPADPATATVISPAEADRIYAATGVWLRAPRLPLIPTADPVGTLTLAALDAGVGRVALPALPPLVGASPDQAILPQFDPPAPGTVFERDARGFVLASPEGSLTPDGILVFAGLPAIIPPTRPGTPVPEIQPEIALEAAPGVAPEVAAVAAPPLAPREALVAADPALDPTLAPHVDVATAGGVGLSSLAPLIRPLVRPDTLAAATPEVAAAPQLVAFAGPRAPLRPEGLAPVPPETVPETTPDAAIAAVPPETALPDPVTDPSLAVADTVAAILAAAPPDPLAGATPLAIASARVPEPRPQNFAEVVASAEARSATAPAAPQDASLAVVAPAAQIAPVTVAPSGPVSGDVAANATLAEAIDLREVNLIGVFGRPNDRRALVRLANGRYVRVGVGDSLDGGQVAAIGDNALNYVKRGQTITIAIPNG